MNLAAYTKKKFPDTPGVYFFKKGRVILYIGKATSLSDRVRSYFSADVIKTRGPAIVDMVTQATTVTYKETDSVLEALLLESRLIKTHQPKYNVKERDDKSYNSVIITDEQFPRVLIVRSRDVRDGVLNVPIAREYGPFPNAGQLREALRLLQKIFPFFDTTKPINTLGLHDQKKIHLNVEIGLYPDVFSGAVSTDSYRKTIHHLQLFFEGKKKNLIRRLESEMRRHARQQAFERAAQCKRTIFALNHINDVSMLRDEDGAMHDGANVPLRIESYDIAHIAGTNTVGVCVVSENYVFKKTDYKKFIIRAATGNDDYAALREVLSRRFAHPEWRFPDIVVVDGGIGQRNSALQVLQQIPRAHAIHVVSVVKDDKHRAREVLCDTPLSSEQKEHIIALNAETHRFAIAFHRKRRGVIK